jgi:HEAT repeat protein
MFQKLRSFLGGDDDATPVVKLDEATQAHVRALMTDIMASPNSSADPGEAVTVRDRRAADMIRAAQNALTELRPMGESIVPILLENIGRGHYTLTTLLAQVINPDKAVEQMTLYLKSTMPQARIDAARVLGQAKAKGALDPLLALLEDSNEQVRLTTIQALGNLGDPRALEHLRPLVGTFHPEKQARLLQSTHIAIQKLEQAL